VPTDYFKLEDNDEDILHDFSASHEDALESMEHDLFQLEKDPKSSEIINSIFRTMHTVKGNFRMLSIDPLVDYAHAMEEVFSLLRSSQIPFTPYVQESLLLGLDKLRTEVGTMMATGELQMSPLKKITNAYNKLVHVKISEVDIAAAEIIKLIAGDPTKHLPLSIHHEHSFSKPQILEEPDTDSDLQYFKILSIRTDSHSPFWDGRSGTILKICLGMNQLLSQPADNRQLVTASLLHDVGMVFIPTEIMQKTVKLNTLEEKSLQEHVGYGYEWVKRMSGWQDAAQMVHQHHERMDGQGYPNNTPGEDICTGAKILAVADTFYAISNQRADRFYKRSLVRATAEINSCTGSQFDEEVVDAFNQVIRQRFTKA